MSRRSWIAQSSRRTGGGPHADSRARREREARALDEAYNEAANDRDTAIEVRDAPAVHWHLWCFRRARSQE